MIKNAKIVDLNFLEAACALSRSTINGLVRSKKFPSPLKMLGDTKRWLASDVEIWMKEIIAVRNLQEKDRYVYHRFENEHRSLRFLCYKALKDEYNVARASVYVLMKEEGFPCKLQLSKRRVGWVESEVMDWFEHRKPK